MLCTLQNTNKADSCPRSSSISSQMPTLNSSFQNCKYQAVIPHATNSGFCWSFNSCYIPPALSFTVSLGWLKRLLHCEL